jgi:hypothetical protein
LVVKGVQSIRYVIVRTSKELAECIQAVAVDINVVVVRRNVVIGVEWIVKVVVVNVIVVE